MKLGDFGIAATAKLARGARANAYNPAFRPPNVGALWTPEDDIYQVGLLALTLVKGEAVYAGVKKPAANSIKDAALRDAIKKAVDGNRRQRYKHAEEMADALA